MNPDPYEPPEDNPEFRDQRGFIPRTVWHIRTIFLIPKILFFIGWIVFGLLALPASIDTANY